MRNEGACSVAKGYGTNWRILSAPERCGLGSRRGAKKYKVFCADLRKSAGEKKVSRRFSQIDADKSYLHIPLFFM